MMDFPSAESFIVSVDLQLSSEPEWFENAACKEIFSFFEWIFSVL